MASVRGAAGRALPQEVTYPSLNCQDQDAHHLGVVKSCRHSPSIAAGRVVRP